MNLNTVTTPLSATVPPGAPAKLELPVVCEQIGDAADCIADCMETLRALGKHDKALELLFRDDLARAQLLKAELDQKKAKIHKVAFTANPDALVVALCFQRLTQH